MTHTLDASILELLASKICHDLISPIGAVNNGVELLAEMGADAGPDATELIAYSAGQASAKLQAFRLGYGVGGADPNIKAEDVHRAIQAIVGADKKIVQDWNPHGDLGGAAKEKGFCKILTCALLLTMECLPKGGKLGVSAGPGGATLVTGTGRDAGPRGKLLEALKLAIAPAALEPKEVHAFMTGQLAMMHGFTIAPAPAGADSCGFVIGKA